MKKNNASIIRAFKIINISIILLIITNLLFYSEEILHKNNLIAPYYITLFIAFFIWFTSMNGNQFYAIDTKGETITFETKNVGFFSIFKSNLKKIDLPKYKLIKYEYKRGVISNKIFFYIKSKKNDTPTKYKFDLAFVSQTNIKRILNELNKIVENNNKTENNKEGII